MIFHNNLKEYSNNYYQKSIKKSIRDRLAVDYKQISVEKGYNIFLVLSAYLLIGLANYEI